MIGHGECLEQGLQRLRRPRRGPLLIKSHYGNGPADSWEGPGINF